MIGGYSDFPKRGVDIMAEVIVVFYIMLLTVIILKKNNRPSGRTALLQVLT